MRCVLLVIHLTAVLFFFFFSKQKTAYEMRISDWSSDVCSSDLLHFQMKQRQPFHSNALSFTARDGDGEILVKRMYFSIGGGFVVDEEEAGRNSRGSEDEVSLPFPFTSGDRQSVV